MFVRLFLLYSDRWRCVISCAHRLAAKHGLLRCCRCGCCLLKQTRLLFQARVWEKRRIIKNILFDKFLALFFLAICLSPSQQCIWQQILIIFIVAFFCCRVRLQKTLTLSMQNFPAHTHFRSVETRFWEELFTDSMKRNGVDYFDRFLCSCINNKFFSCIFISSKRQIHFYPLLLWAAKQSGQRHMHLMHVWNNVTLNSSLNILHRALLSGRKEKKQPKERLKTEIYENIKTARNHNNQNTYISGMEFAPLPASAVCKTWSMKTWNYANLHSAHTHTKWARQRGRTTNKISNDTNINELSLFLLCMRQWTKSIAHCLRCVRFIFYENSSFFSLLRRVCRLVGFFYWILVVRRSVYKLSKKCNLFLCYFCSLKIDEQKYVTHTNNIEKDRKRGKNQLSSSNDVTTMAWKIHIKNQDPGEDEN